MRMIIICIMTQKDKTTEPVQQRSLSRVPEMDSEVILQGSSEALIRHGRECYRLRCTRQNKLILTK